MRQASLEVNEDTRPVALFEALLLWNKQFSASSRTALSLFRGFTVGKSAAVAVLAAVLLLLASRGKASRLRDIGAAYCVATTGFFAMLTSLILIFAFQIWHGYLYHQLGLLVSVFMAGTAAGSLWAGRVAGEPRKNLRLFLGTEIFAAAFAVGLALFFTGKAGPVSGYPSFIFMPLFFASGLPVGIQFSLAAGLYLKKGGRMGEAVGVLYFCDLLGAWLAGIVTGIVFLPVMGLFNTCMVAVVFKLSSLGLMMLSIFFDKKDNLLYSSGS